MGRKVPCGSLMERTIPNLLAGAVDAAADKIWLFHEEATFTYEEAWRRIGTAAAGLAAHGIGRGDLVLVPMRNTPDHLFTWLALMRLGAIHVAANPAAIETELKGLIDQTQAKLVLDDAAVAGLQPDADNDP
jgi:crotonobetaine/carnitine-CoA ligase